MFDTLLGSRRAWVLTRALSCAVVAVVVGAACSSTPTAQDIAGNAVVGYVADDDILSEAGFDDDCVRSAAAGLPDELAQAIADDDGRIDFDVDDQDRDDVYDFYNCADERDLARAIADDSQLIDGGCLEDTFAATDIGDTMRELDADDPSRLGDFFSVEDGPCAVPGPDPATGRFKEQTEDFLNDDLLVSGQVGGDVSNAECIEPSSADVGEMYSCTADVEGVGSFTFDAVVDGDDSFLVTDYNTI